MTSQPPDFERHLSWQDRLRSASTESEVVEITREFLATVSPYELARLPVDLRPGKVNDAEDLAAIAFDVVSMDKKPTAAHAVVRRLAGFFSDACAHLSRIATPRNRRGGGFPTRAAG